VMKDKQNDYVMKYKKAAEASHRCSSRRGKQFLCVSIQKKLYKRNFRENPIGCK